jgi:hypothetical protein
MPITRHGLVHPAFCLGGAARAAFVEIESKSGVERVDSFVPWGKFAREISIRERFVDKDNQFRSG